MIPYLTPMHIRLENQRRTASSINEQVRAELEARQFRKADKAQTNQPAFGFIPRRLKLWRTRSL